MKITLSKKINDNDHLVVVSIKGDTILKSNDLDLDSKEILRALFISSVPDVDIATDIGIFKTMYKFADKEKIKYVVNGHNFRSEGLDPLVWTYMDRDLPKQIFLLTLLQKALQ